MTVVETAERKSRWRAYGFLFLAALTGAVMVVAKNGHGTDFTQGLWFGLLTGCALSLLPLKRWLRPNDEVLRLLDDEGARENRRLSCTIGFWAAMALSIVIGMVSHFDAAIRAEEVGQFVATAGIISAITAFAILELRAAR